MISDFEKRIYNDHLVVSRKSNGKAFKLKKNFDNLDDGVKMNLEKLAKLFNLYPNLIPYDFFMAPHLIYEGCDYYPLEFYTKQRAINCYTQYVQRLQIQDPDSLDSLNRLSDSLKFVVRYCIENNLQLSDYEINLEGTMPCFVNHLKTHKINYYTLHALTFKKPQIDSRLLEFIFPEFYNVFQKTKNKFMASAKMKEFSKRAITKLQTKLQTKLPI